MKPAAKLLLGKSGKVHAQGNTSQSIAAQTMMIFAFPYLVEGGGDQRNKPQHTVTLARKNGPSPDAKTSLSRAALRGVGPYNAEGCCTMHVSRKAGP